MTAGSNTNGTTGKVDVDVVVVGAGFAGLYLLHRLRQAGFRDRGARVRAPTSAARGTGTATRAPAATSRPPTTPTASTPSSSGSGPGRRSTPPSRRSCATSSTSPTSYDLRTDIRFATRVTAATWDDAARRWRVRTGPGRRDQLPLLRDGHRLPVAAEGRPTSTGADRFQGEVYFTSRWPHEGVDFTGKRVGGDRHRLLGHPVDPADRRAGRAAHRVPAHAELLAARPQRSGPRSEQAGARAPTGAAYRQAARWSRRRRAARAPPVDAAAAVVRRRAAAPVSRRRGRPASCSPSSACSPTRCSTGSQRHRGRVDPREDPRDRRRSRDRRDALPHRTIPFGTKRPCLDTGYFATFNLPARPAGRPAQAPDHDRHRDRHRDRRRESFEFDAIVYATGFDAMTGAIVAVDITGRDGVTLKDKWADGPADLSRAHDGRLPELLHDHRPGQPVGAVEHGGVDRAARRLDRRLPRSTCATQGFETDRADARPPRRAGSSTSTTAPTSRSTRTANSWYMGANVPGKPRVFLPYIGGVDVYRAACDEVVEQGYLGFQPRRPRRHAVQRRRDPPAAAGRRDRARDHGRSSGCRRWSRCRPQDARAFMAAGGRRAAARARGGRDRRRRAARRRPATSTTGSTGRPTPGPTRVVAYFHGGGWVLGSQRLRRPVLPRPVRAHRRGHRLGRLPARARGPVPGGGRRRVRRRAVDRRQRRRRSAAIPGQLAVAGWSAGGNLAAVVVPAGARRRRPGDRRPAAAHPGHRLRPDTGSYQENGDGYVLTKPLMRWFWDHYADEADRTNPSARRCGPRPLRPAAGLDCDRRVRSAARRGRGLRRGARRPASRSRTSRRAATRTPRYRWST